jgi:hypothetical protein
VEYDWCLIRYTFTTIFHIKYFDIYQNFKLLFSITAYDLHVSFPCSLLTPRHHSLSASCRWHLHWTYSVPHSTHSFHTQMLYLFMAERRFVSQLLLGRLDFITCFLNANEFDNMNRKRDNFSFLRNNCELWKRSFIYTLYRTELLDFWTFSILRYSRD